MPVKVIVKVNNLYWLKSVQNPKKKLCPKTVYSNSATADQLGVNDILT